MKKIVNLEVKSMTNTGASSHLIVGQALNSYGLMLTNLVQVPTYGNIQEANHNTIVSIFKNFSKFNILRT